MRRYTVFTIFVILMNIIMAEAFVKNVYAKENVFDLKDIKLIYKNQEIESTSDNIYYLNDDIEVMFNNASVMDAEFIQEKTAELKESMNKDIMYYSEEYNAVSEYSDEGFGPFNKLEGDSYIVANDENRGASGYVRKAFIFEKIVSYKIYEEIDGEKAVIDVIDREYVSEPYQFIFDNTVPVIVSSSGSDELGNVKEGQSYTLNIKDDVGIDTVRLYKNSEIAEYKKMTDEKRIIEYDYNVVLTSTKEKTSQMKLEVTDLAGNVNEYDFQYTMDNTAPCISINVKDGHISADDITTAVSASDENGKVFIFYKCIYTAENGEQKVIDNITEEFEGKGTIEKRYEGNGIYDIISFAYDESGNYSETIRRSIAVDKDAPVTRFENIVCNSIYNTKVSVYAYVSDMFYDGMTVDISGKITDGAGERMIELAPFEAGARNNKNIYELSMDGKYDLTLTAKDISGHASQAKVSFTIDKTAPDIDINVGEGESVISKKPEIKISTRDELSEYETLVSLYHKNNESGFKEIKTEKIVSIGKSADFSMDVPYEGEYMIKAETRDLAGNCAERTIQFTVDETPPVIGYLDDFNEKYLKSFSLPEYFSDYIQDMTTVKYKAYLNGKNINSCEIKKDGKYIVQVVASDDAGNKSEKAALFIVDSTAPKIIVQGIDNSGQVKKDEMVKLTLLDENDYFKELNVNGKLTPINDNREILVKASEYGDYDISVVASDYAGNEVTEVVKMECALSANPFTVKIDKSDIETLTKNEGQIREHFFSRKVFLGVVIFSGLIVLTAVIFAVFAFVDTKENKR